MKITKPVFIIGCPRSGTTLLYTILKEAPEFWSSHSEAHFIWEKFVPDKRDPMFAIHLTAADVKDGDKEYIEERYFERAYPNAKAATIAQYFFYNRFRALFSPIYYLWRKTLAAFRSFSQRSIRILDKTPPNTFRVGFLAEAFPDAKFIYITRDGATNISSLIEGWKSTGRFNFKFRSFYPENEKINIKGYDGKVWKFTHAPGWESYLDKPLEEVCAFQWTSAHQCTQDELAKLDSSRYQTVKYEELVANPEAEIKKLCDFVDIEYSNNIAKHCKELPVVSTNTKPDPKKWLKNKDLINNIAAQIDAMQIKLGYPSLLKQNETVNL